MKRLFANWLMIAILMTGGCSVLQRTEKISHAKAPEQEPDPRIVCSFFRKSEVTGITVRWKTNPVPRALCHVMRRVSTDVLNSYDDEILKSSHARMTGI